MEIRQATKEDAESIVAIYNEGIRERQATFETTERSVDDIVPWLTDEARRTHPLLVAVGQHGVTKSKVCGWIHASAYRPRLCYSGIGDFSVYVLASARGRGIGGALMGAFIPECASSGLWKLIGRIFVENRASRALCAHHGFREVGVYERHAQLDGVWRNVVIVERMLPTTANGQSPR